MTDPGALLLRWNACNSVTFVTSWRSNDFLRSVGGRACRVMFFRSFQDLIMWRRLVFVVIRLAIIFAHRIIGKLIPHQNPPQIGMSLETNPIKVIDLTFLEFGAPPDG